MMKDYRHMMEQVALSDQKKEEIMEMIENKQTQKRRMPHMTKIVLAAALAVGCVLSIAAGLPGQVYNFMAGGAVTVTEGAGQVDMTIDADGAGSPVKLEDGRLWLEGDGQKIDITDKVDESTPYVMERTDPATGNKGYVIAGGTVDDFGWAELFLDEGGTCSMMGENAWDNLVPIDGKDVPLSQLTEEQIEWLNKDDNSTLMQTTNRPWLDKAIAQLGLEMALGIAD
ncbi:MAG: hypothetical protein HDT43_08325 [Ruminococcaceae bacterium]|nr:hypothetical protein [Oscillospiraceae bacterium]